MPRRLPRARQTQTPRTQVLTRKRQRKKRGRTREQDKDNRGRDWSKTPADTDTRAGLRPPEPGAQSPPSLRRGHPANRVAQCSSLQNRVGTSCHAQVSPYVVNRCQRPRPQHTWAAACSPEARSPNARRKSPHQVQDSGTTSTPELSSTSTALSPAKRLTARRKDSCQEMDSQNTPAGRRHQGLP